ncbi:MAG: CDP-diacylglycerol--glycerol-3-phosphate 3-phosphatidyltransferase [Holosporales bacterium]
MLVNKNVSLLTASNFITGLRIVMAPFLYWQILAEDWQGALLVCILGGLTDFLDGAIARHFNQTSFFGEIFDPIADKIMVTAIYIAFFKKHIIPESVFFVIIGRDIFLILGSFFVIKNKLKIPLTPLILSKINTFLQFFLCAWILIMNVLLKVYTMPSIFSTFTSCIIYGTLVLTVLSGIQYAKRFFIFFKKQQNI